MSWEEEVKKKRFEQSVNILKSLYGDEIQKARSGVYADTSENRKLGRVGQKYGGKKQEEDKVQIETVNYFGERTESNDFNAKVLYRKNNSRLQLANVYIDFFNRHVFVSGVQDKSGKVLKGFEKAINDYAEKTGFRFQ